MTDFAMSSHPRWLFGTAANIYGHRLAAMSRDARDAQVYSIDKEGAETDKSDLYDGAAASVMQRIQEEEALLRHFCRQIQLLAGCAPGRDPSLPTLTKTWRLAATAMVYFRRFYLNNSLLKHDPRVMMLACILLAGKVEESAVSTRELLKVNPRIQLEDILHAELSLMQGLHFHLKVYHPHSIATTLLVDLRRKAALGAEAALDADAVRAWIAALDKQLDLILLTDAPLCFNPLDVAVACLVATQPSALGNTLQEFLTRRLGRTAADILQHAPLLAAALSAAQACVEGREEEAVKRVIARCRAEAAWGSTKGAAKRPKSM